MALKSPAKGGKCQEMGSKVDRIFSWPWPNFWMMKETQGCRHRVVGELFAHFSIEERHFHFGLSHMKEANLSVKREAEAFL